MKTTLTLEVITPLFMSGADSRKLELRAASFKGLMRFWWRAMKAENNIFKLKNEEEAIFGGTGEKKGKSGVFVRIVPRNLIRGNNLKRDYNLDINLQKTGKDQGLGYLLYSTILPNRERPYFRPGTTFDLILTSKDKKTSSQALTAFWLAIYLGGFGTRARRGGGNLAINEIIGDVQSGLPEFKVPPEISDVNDMARWIQDQFQKAKRIIAPLSPFSKDYSVIPGGKLILGSKAIHGWKETLNDIGTEYMKFRNSIRNNFFAGPNFGIPVMHRHFSVRMVGYAIPSFDRFTERRASPLIFKIFRFFSISTKEFYKGNGIFRSFYWFT